MTRVLVIEDDVSTQEFYAHFFTVQHPEEFTWHLAESGEQALRFLSRNPIDIVILDWTLPGINGLATLQRLRSDPAMDEVMIFMVTGRASREECVSGLKAGADDYMAKPIYADELLARLGSLARRKGRPAEQRVFELDGLRLATPAGELTLCGKQLRLPPKQLELLRIFLRRPDIIHAPRHLWDMVWGYNSKRWKHALVAHICALKKNLQPWSRRLESHYGKGYLLNSRVLTPQP